jgi:hypothetical protein
MPAPRKGVHSLAITVSTSVSQVASSNECSACETIMIVRPDEPGSVQLSVVHGRSRHDRFLSVSLLM